MVAETPNLKLKKPSGTDYVDITVLNGNMDILDDAVSNAKVKVEQDPNGIKVGEVTLQKASSIQSGLLSKEDYSKFDGKQDAGNYALKDEIPDVSNKADKSEIPDISGKADKSDIPDISGKLDKSGGTMTGYLADKTVLQVRNIMTATEKPADTIGQDGDVCVIPGASGGGVSSVSNSFDTLTRNLVTTVDGVSSAPVNIPGGGGGDDEFLSLYEWSMHGRSFNMTLFPHIICLKGQNVKESTINHNGNLFLASPSGEYIRDFTIKPNAVATLDVEITADPTGNRYGYCMRYGETPDGRRTRPFIVQVYVEGVEGGGGLN